MTQKIKIASIEVKEGTNERGPWKNFIITGEDKSKVSTFDNQASTLGVGDVIGGEIEVKGKYINLKSFTVIEKAVEKPVEKRVLRDDRDDRIAEQVAVKAVVELAVGGFLSHNNPLVLKTIEWCADKLGVDLHNAPESSQDKQGTAQKAEVVESSSDSPIDLDWLKESLQELQWADAAGYLKKKYNASGVSVSEKVKVLTPEQAKEFVAEVERRLNKDLPY